MRTSSQQGWDKSKALHVPSLCPPATRCAAPAGGAACNGHKPLLGLVPVLPLEHNLPAGHLRAYVGGQCAAAVTAWLQRILRASPANCAAGSPVAAIALALQRRSAMLSAHITHPHPLACLAIYGPVIKQGHNRAAGGWSPAAGQSFGGAFPPLQRGQLHKTCRQATAEGPWPPLAPLTSRWIVPLTSSNRGLTPTSDTTLLAYTATLLGSTNSLRGVRIWGKGGDGGVRGVQVKVDAACTQVGAAGREEGMACWQLAEGTPPASTSRRHGA